MTYDPAAAATRDAWRAGAFGHGADFDLDAMDAFYARAKATEAPPCTDCHGDGVVGVEPASPTEHGVRDIDCGVCRGEGVRS